MKNLQKKNLKNNVGRFGGKTKKIKDNYGNSEYETEIRNSSNELLSNINEYYMKIKNEKQQIIECWTKRTTFPDNTIIFEIFLIKNNQLYKYVKNYEKIDDLTKEMKNKITLNSSFKKNNLINNNDNCLTKIFINEINTIDESIKKIEEINQQIIIFNENSNRNNNNFNMLLNLYKYLTIFQKLIDKPKTSINISITTKINKILANLIIGTLLITSSLIAKNTQRVFWINGFNQQQNLWQYYYKEIFLNKENHIITFIDTVINAFFISAIANWSRNTIWNIIENIICHKKNKKNNEIKIKQVTTDTLVKYKCEFETLLYEENELKLSINIPKIKRIANFAKKINEIKNCCEFKYHPNFTKEIKKINELQQQTDDNKPIDNIKRKQIISSVNKTIDNFTNLKKSIVKPLTWKERIQYSVNDLSLELVTFFIAHPIMAGAMANNIEEKFTIYNWSKYIFRSNILLWNSFAYYSMRPINYFFKSGLEMISIPTNLCPKIIENWIEKQSKYTKVSIAILLFFLIAIATNVIKTEATLVTKFGIEKSYQYLNSKLKKEETWLFFILTTASQMFVFSLATIHKIFNFEILWKKILNFFQPNINLVEENLKKLETNSNLPVFTNQEKEIIEKSIIELKKTHTTIPHFKTGELNLQLNKEAKKFNAQLINENEQLINPHSLIDKAKIISHIPI